MKKKYARRGATVVREVLRYFAVNHKSFKTVDDLHAHFRATPYSALSSACQNLVKKGYLVRQERGRYGITAEGLHSEYAEKSSGQMTIKKISLDTLAGTDIEKEFIDSQIVTLLSDGISRGEKEIKKETAIRFGLDGIRRSLNRQCQLANLERTMNEECVEIYSVTEAGKKSVYNKAQPKDEGFQIGDVVEIFDKNDVSFGNAIYLGAAPENALERYKHMVTYIFWDGEKEVHTQEAVQMKVAFDIGYSFVPIFVAKVKRIEDKSISLEEAEKKLGVKIRIS